MSGNIRFLLLKNMITKTHISLFEPIILRGFFCQHFLDIHFADIKNIFFSKILRK